MDTFTCDNCGFPNAMIYYRCKIICQNCGFMLDCSDLDVGNEIKQASLRQQKEKVMSEKVQIPGRMTDGE